MCNVHIHNICMYSELQCRPTHIIVYFSLSQIDACIFNKFFNVNY